MTNDTYRRIVNKCYDEDQTKRNWPRTAQSGIYDLAKEEMPEPWRERFPSDAERMYSLAYRGALEEALDAGGRKRPPAPKKRCEQTSDFGAVEASFRILDSMDVKRAIERGSKPRRVAPNDFDWEVITTFRDFLEKCQGDIGIGLNEIRRIIRRYGDFWGKHPKLKLPEVMAHFGDEPPTSPVPVSPTPAPSTGGGGAAVQLRPSE